MRRSIPAVVIVVTLALFLVDADARAEGIHFDERPASNSASGRLTDEYSALGVHFESTDDASVWSGVSGGDPGGFGLEGSNGPQFLGFDGPSFAAHVRFDRSAWNLAFEIARASGAGVRDLVTVEGLFEGQTVRSLNVTLGPLHEWRRVAIENVEIDELRISGSGPLSRPFGIDHLRWQRVPSTVIRFDEVPATNSETRTVTAEFASLGVRFATSDDGAIWSGLSAGDPGGWGLEGEEGAQFLGFDGASFQLVASFDDLVEALTLDVARATASLAGDTCTIEGRRQGQRVSLTTIPLGAVNEWRKAFVPASVDEIRLLGSRGLTHAFGADNLRFLRFPEALITFEEISPTGASLQLVGTEFESLGVRLALTDGVTIARGVRQGDPAAFGLEGTHGSSFLGFSGASPSLVATFDEQIFGFALDIARGLNTSGDTNVRLEGFRAGRVTESIDVPLGRVNAWTTVRLSGAIDEVRLAGVGTGPRRFGVDGVSWTRRSVFLTRGDCNQDERVDISDALCILGWLFLGAPAPGCIASTDANGDGRADLSDAVRILGFLFLGAPPPVSPFGLCGRGSASDSLLTCEQLSELCR